MSVQEVAALLQAQSSPQDWNQQTEIGEWTEREGPHPIPPQ